MSDLNKIDSEGTLSDATTPHDVTPDKHHLTAKQDQPLPLTPQEKQQQSRHHPRQVSSSSHGSASGRAGAGVDQASTTSAGSTDSKATKKKSHDDPSDKEYREIAKKLFNEEFVSIQPEEYTQFLAANDEESSKIRNHYMDLFKWNANLLTSTRMLCSKLYLKGESQEIDRILSSFTKSYIKQHQTNVFCTRNFEKIYIIIYSLILLNTALHNSELNKKSKISQADYIKNTFTTFIQQNPKSSKNLSIKQRIIIERELSNYYESLLKDELHLKQQGATSTASAPPPRRDPAASAPPAPTTATTTITTSATDNDVNGTATTSVPTAVSVAPPTADHPEIQRQPSGSSIWSTDTADNRRASLVMKRMSSATSSVSQYTAGGSSLGAAGSRSSRVGFGRALASGAVASRTNSNSTTSGRVSQMSSMQNLRSRRLGDAGAPGSQLHKRSSRSSVVSRDSDLHDDSLSVLSFDTVNITRLHLDSGASGSDGGYQNLEDFNVNNYQDGYDLTLELQGSPYLKEGLLKLKVLNNDVGSDGDGIQAPMPSASTGSTRTGFFSSFFRQAQVPSPSVRGSTSSPLAINKFTENFVVVSKGELALYSFDPKVIKKHKKPAKKVDDDEVVGDGNWLNNAANVGTYNLCSTVASMEKPVLVTGSNKKMILWSLTFPKTSKKPAKKFIFEAGTREIALEFVNACNFWAAKITAIPTLEESVSSIEYGWTNLDGLIGNRDQFKKLKYISKWEPIPKGVYLSNYVVANDGSNVLSETNGTNNHAGMMRQFVRTYKYYNHLRKVYHEFIGLQNKFLNNFPQKLYGGTNYSRIISNYDQKIAEYKAELLKYKNYLIILGFGLQLRFDMEEADKEERKQAQKEGLDVELIEPNLDEEEPEEDDDLTKLVKAEIRKLFINMKDVSKYIPSFQASKSLTDLTSAHHRPLDDDYHSIPPVTAPTSYTLSQYRDNESPINQLMHQTSDGPYPAGTIIEEEEREEASEETTPTNSFETSKKLGIETAVHVVAM
ncbi:hypothetical protein DIURU_005108 [Diutina rugosa]|uniref:SEC7 domain-containing protein n=1 Tax=Diutina rugosa TaxID=5481 RepID=A0A642ULM9_DIURU|nr:uncharacterized protein DIURU_005108 [Diutina rugosa]KAA8897677.1 hypothetical protein DIURU_005108 [Diutina rugosa]